MDTENNNIPEEQEQVKENAREEKPGGGMYDETIKDENIKDMFREKFDSADFKEQNSEQEPIEEELPEEETPEPPPGVAGKVGLLTFNITNLLLTTGAGFIADESRQTFKLSAEEKEEMIQAWTFLAEQNKWKSVPTNFYIIVMMLIVYGGIYHKAFTLKKKKSKKKKSDYPFSRRQTKVEDAEVIDSGFSEEDFEMPNFGGRGRPSKEVAEYRRKIQELKNKWKEQHGG